MEKRPILNRDYCGLLTGQSCYDFCKFVSEDYDMKGEHELALDWLAEANLYRMEIELGMKSYNKNPMIEEEITKDQESWLAVTIDGRDQLKQWEMHQKTSLRQKMERDMAREKKRAESGKEGGSQEAA
jgi:hypothetical protein